MDKYDVGIITDSEAGCNLAFNFSANGYTAVLYNTALENMQRNDINRFISEIQEMGILAATSTPMVAGLLKKPGIIFVVSVNGVFAVNVMNELYTLLEKGDIIIDTCDVNYKTAASRCVKFGSKGIAYMGTGFPGTAQEALSGASFLMGGSFDAYNVIYEMLSRISAKYDGYPCCVYMGPEGAGQYAKMIYNVICFTVIQAMSEAVSLLKNVLSCGSDEIADIISEWGTGDNEGYLTDVLYDVLSKKNAETGEYIFDIVSDKAGMNKSAIWFCSDAADYAVPVNSVNAALDTRNSYTLSKIKNSFDSGERAPVGNIRITNDEKKSFEESVRNSLYLCTLCVYVQAFALLKRVSDINSWGIDPIDVARTLQGGSCIRSRMLLRVIEAFRSEESLNSLLENYYFQDVVRKYTLSLRDAVSAAARAGVPVPVFMASLSYIDLYASSFPEAGIAELMNDYIYGTGFELKGKEKKRFHVDWQEIRKESHLTEITK